MPAYGPLELVPLLVAALRPELPPPPFEIRSYPSPNHYRGRDGEQPDTLFIHYTAGKGSALATARGFASPAREAAAHFCIGRPFGDVVQCVDLDDAAWHAGDGGKARIPSAAQLDAALADGSGFVPIGKVPPKPRHNNCRSVGIELCNRGYAPGGPGPYVQGRHRNPDQGERSWESYPDTQINTLVPMIKLILIAKPTIRFITGHEDATHADTNGDIPSTPAVERKAGAKSDPGPAFDYGKLPLVELGLKRVAYDFKRHGWTIAA